MINYAQAKIQELWIHFIGSAAQNEGIQFCERNINIQSEEIDHLLKSYFFDNFKEPEFSAFDFLDGNIDLNPLYNYTNAIFDESNTISTVSKQIAKLLYNNSKHPNIKSGDLLIAHVKDILVEDEVIDAICIFKSENKQAFINLEKFGKEYKISNDEGINTGKIDKACVIFNTDKKTGYKILAKDHSNKSKEAQFWTEKFLNLKPREDDFHHTKHYIQATKAFVSERLKPLHDIDKIQEVEIMNKSLNFLKHEDQFNQREFDNKVFNDPELVNDFQLFKLDFQQENNLALSDHFQVNPLAVKQQSKIFKSVLKLDKNFHVYIHGNRSMIEKGKDSDGRKFYKIYYENES